MRRTAYLPTHEGQIAYKWWIAYNEWIMYNGQNKE